MTILDSFYLLFEGDAKGVESVLDTVRQRGKKTADELAQVDKSAVDMSKSITKAVNDAGKPVDTAAARKAADEIADALGQPIDTKPLTKVGEEAEDALGKKLPAAAKKSKEELEKTEKGIKDVDKAAYRMGETIGQSIRQLAGWAAGFFAVQSAAQSFFAAVDVADHLDETAERLDINIETLSLWGDAVKIAGGTIDGLTGSIGSFNSMLTTMEVTGKSRAAPFLKELGIDIENATNKGKTAFELFPAISKAMDGMDKAKSTAIGRKLGLDAGTIALLQMGGDELDELMKRTKALGVVTKEQGEIAAAYNDQLDYAKHALRSLWLEISTAVLPALTWFGKKIEEVLTFMRENKDFMVGLMIAIGSAIAVFAVPALVSMAVAAWAALAPFIAVAAAVAGLATVFALVYDDIVNFMEGNDSLIGQFLNEYPQVEAVLKGIGDYYTWLGETAKSVGQIIWAALGLVARAIGFVFQGMAQVIADRFGFIGRTASDIGGVFTSLGALVKGVIQSWIDSVSQFIDKFGGIVGVAKTIGGAITGALSSAKNQLGIKAPVVDGAGVLMGPTTPRGATEPIPGLAQGKAQLKSAATSAISTQTSNSIRNSAVVNKQTTVSTGPITISTPATDTKGIAQSIASSLQEQIRNTNDEFNDGVVA